VCSCCIILVAELRCGPFLSFCFLSLRSRCPFRLFVSNDALLSRTGSFVVLPVFVVIVFVSDGNAGVKEDDVDVDNGRDVSFDVNAIDDSVCCSGIRVNMDTGLPLVMMVVLAETVSFIKCVAVVVVVVGLAAVAADKDGTTLLDNGASVGSDGTGVIMDGWNSRESNNGFAFAGVDSFIAAIGTLEVIGLDDDGDNDVNIIGSIGSGWNDGTSFRTVIPLDTMFEMVSRIGIC
jgi:hypothetical protein